MDYYVSVCVRVRACVCVCHVCLHMCVYVSVYLCVSLYLCVFVALCVYLCVCMSLLPPPLCHMSCSCVAGDNATPDNKAVQQSLSAMLTPYLYQQISKMGTREVSPIVLSNAPLTTRCSTDIKAIEQQHRESLSDLG